MKTAVMIGDSHSQIVFPLLTGLLNLNFLEIISEPGWGVKKFMSKGIPQDLPSADICIVALGGNNFDMNNLSYMNTVDEFLDVLKPKFKRIVWIGPYFSTREDVDHRHAVTNLFLKLHLPISVGYIETYKLGREIAHRDGVHYTRDGYKKLIDLYIKKLRGLALGVKPRVWLSHPKFAIPVSTMIGVFALLAGFSGGD